MSPSFRRVLPLLVLLAPFAGCLDGPTDPAAGGADGAAGDVTATTETGSAVVSVVMSGLNNPRQLAFGPEGALYVAEAGTRTVVPGPCAPVFRGEHCYSGTGSITRLWRGQQTRVATGLPSIWNEIGGDLSGPQDISFQGRGGAFVTIGWGGQPEARAALGPAGNGLGTLIQVAPSGEWKVVTDVSAFEQANNPAGGPSDTNPYGLLAEAGRRFVTDAGANAVLEVAPNGAVSLVATFPRIDIPTGPFNPPFAQVDPVPTEIVRGPDGALYVSQLTGFPFVPGAAGVFRLDGGAPTLHAGGFTMITDIDWDEAGNLYVLQYANAPFFTGPGSLIRVAPNGTRTVLASDLLHATGVVAGPDGALYVSVRGGVGDLPGTGQVLRIQP